MRGITVLRSWGHRTFGLSPNAKPAAVAPTKTKPATAPVKAKPRAPKATRIPIFTELLGDDFLRQDAARRREMARIERCTAPAVPAASGPAPAAIVVTADQIVAAAAKARGRPHDSRPAVGDLMARATPTDPRVCAAGAILSAAAKARGETL